MRQEKSIWLLVIRPLHSEERPGLWLDINSNGARLRPFIAIEIITSAHSECQDSVEASQMPEIHPLSPVENFVILHIEYDLKMCLKCFPFDL